MCDMAYDFQKTKKWINISCDAVTSGDSHTEVLPSDGAREEKKAFSKCAIPLK